MAFRITDDCIGCTVCLCGCPVSAIREQDGKCVIDPDLCIKCGACAAVCMIGAVEMDFAEDQANDMQ